MLAADAHGDLQEECARDLQDECAGLAGLTRACRIVGLNFGLTPYVSRTPRDRVAATSPGFAGAAPLYLQK